MSIDLESQKQLLNAYKHTYAAKKGLSNPEKWYPRTANEIEDLLEKIYKRFS